MKGLKVKILLPLSMSMISQNNLTPFLGWFHTLLFCKKNKNKCCGSLVRYIVIKERTGYKVFVFVAFFRSVACFSEYSMLWVQLLSYENMSQHYSIHFSHYCTIFICFADRKCPLKSTEID